MTSAGALTSIDPTQNAAPPMSSAPGSTNPDVQVTGAPPTPTTQPTGKMVPVILPDGKPYSIPQERLQDVINDGGKLAAKMVGTDNNRYYIPFDKVHDAMQDGWHMDDAVVDALAAPSVTSGFAKRAVSSMRSAADIMGGEGTANRVGLPDTGQPSGIAEKIGAGGEAVLEFMLGEDALKGLSLGEKLEKIAPVVKSLESHPSLAKLIGGAVRGAAVGGTQAGAEAPAGQRLEAAGEGAAMGALGGAVSEAPAAARAAVGTEGEPGLVRSVLKGKEAVQPRVQSAMRVNPWASAREASQSLLTQLQPSIDNVIADAKTNYGLVDNAAGTNVKQLYDKLDTIEDQIRQVPDGSEEEARWEAARKKVSDQIDDAKQAITDKMGSKGITLLSKADGLFKRAQALKDVQTKVFENPSVVTGNVKYGTPEGVNVDNAINALQKLQNNTKYGAPRLEQALGKQGAEDLMQELHAAQRAGQKALSKQRIAKVIGGALVAAGGLGAIVHHTAPAVSAMMP